jgi:hypothetical protein
MAGYCACQCTKEQHDDRTCDHKCVPYGFVPFEITQDMADGISLQLLVIDLGDSCVIRLESGEPFQINHGTDWWIDALPKAQICHRPFTAVRDAIDSQDKPLPPYLIRSESGGYVMMNTYEDISEDLYISLSALAGHRLPIYEPTEGKWTELCRAGQPTLGPNDSLNIPVGIWRYTR